ncbi:MAG: hypothetical protein ABSG53_04825, partial [Thermoguttaceae bacterium]
TPLGGNGQNAMNVAESQPAIRKPSIRWFWPTPVWLMLVLLATTGFLFLSERYQWFAFNEHKGWTVLIAVASVGVVLLTMSFWWLAALVFRWRFQFSIRSLLVLVVAVALPFSWFAVEMKKAREQKWVAEEIQNAGAEVWCGDDQFEKWTQLPPPPSEPEWLRNLLGPDFIGAIVAVEFSTDFNEAGLEQLARLPQLRYLGFGGTGATDAVLEKVEALTQLRSLNLAATKITDSGLRHLENLDKLENLDLRDTAITDAGLQHVAKLEQLEELDLWHTNVTDGAVEYLKKGTQLRWLRLSESSVTEAGSEKLQEALPDCTVIR